jgi:sigma-B regulation protein RsbU (phosphoserine phosphatase)
MLGGDMLHVYKLSDSKVACYVLDVSGHGTQAALLSVTIRNQLTVNSADATAGHNYGGLISLESQHNRPLDVINELSNHYGELLDNTGHYFTIMYGILDVTTGIFDYISAGHYNPIHFHQGKAIIQEESSGAPIGMFRKLDYEQKQIQLSPGDKLYLFTDGIIEEANCQGEQFGLERLIVQLKLKSEEQNDFESIINALRGWADKDSFKDDIALVEIACRSQSV